MLKMKMSYIAMVALLVVACSGKKEGAHDPDAWQELDDFHEIMAEAYHPLKDSANLGPAKMVAESMAVSADHWMQAPLPSRVDRDETRDKLAQLKIDTRTFADSVAAGASDETLSASLEKLHDSFHAIMEDWHKSGH